MSLVGDDGVFALHVSEDLVEHAGQWVGAEQLRMALATARRHDDYIVYRPVFLGHDGNIVRVRVEFIGTYRPSGERMNMTFRQVTACWRGATSTMTG